MSGSSSGGSYGGGSYTGGGGGGGGGGDFGPSTPPVDCSQLTFTAQVTSPQDAARSVSVGDVLTVQLTQTPSINLLTAAGELVGALVDRVPDLLHCIQEGFAFQASVTHADGGDIRVVVAATSS